MTRKLTSPKPTRQSGNHLAFAALVMGALLVGGASSCSMDGIPGMGQPTAVRQPEPDKPKAASAPTSTQLAQISNHLQRAEQLKAAGRETEPNGGSALDEYRAVLAIDPVNPAARSEIALLADRYRRQAEAANQAGRHKDAITMARRGELIEPDSPDFPDYIAIAHAGLRQWPMAITANQRAIALGSTSAQNRLAHAYFNSGQYGAAARAFAQLARANPKDIDALLMQGRAHRLANQLPGAEQALYRAYEMADQRRRPDIARSLGRVYLAMGKHFVAASFLEEAADTHFTDQSLYEDLSTAHNKTRNTGRWLETVAMGAVLKAMRPGEKLASIEKARARGIKDMLAGNFASAMLHDLLIAAEQGDPESAYLMARVYHRGYGKIRQNLKQARFWYAEGAKRGHRGAQTGLGYMYYRGLGGLKKDMARAAKWFKLAADQNEPGAMARLGLMYEKGVGVPQDTKKASYYLVTAADAGDLAARKRLTELRVWPFAGKTPKPAITGGIGELPPLMVMSSGRMVALTEKTAAPKAAEKNKGGNTGKRKKKACRGGLAALGCAFD